MQPKKREGRGFVLRRDESEQTNHTWGLMTVENWSDDRVHLKYNRARKEYEQKPTTTTGQSKKQEKRRSFSYTEENVYSNTPKTEHSQKKKQDESRDERGGGT